MIQGQTTTNAEQLAPGNPMGTVYPQQNDLPWKKLKDEEKIERLRALVKSLVSMCDRQQQEMVKLREFVWNHSHEENKVVRKITKMESYLLDNPSGILARPGMTEDENAYI